uniref:Uncharacterized protein LOC104242113 n=1 Tax=Nicotiana sylvestris TaxID=4096 RepID=A0A1U7Y837_NICSY|nr:PREDICTED: uncharacterized protein LOC104242113 [Nicotiana sylvestris]
MGSLAHFEAYQRPLAREVHQLSSLGVRLADSIEGGIIVHNRAESSLVAEVKEKQYNDPLLAQLKEEIYELKTTTFSSSMDDGTLRYQGCLCVLDIDDLRGRIMVEAYTSKYSVHPGSTKMYHDLKGIYWWNNMKKDVADFLAKCPNCQQVKAEHQRLGAGFAFAKIGLHLQTLAIAFPKILSQLRQQQDSLIFAFAKVVSQLQH